MHLLYLHQYFAVPESSTGLRSYEMARRLVARGHRVSMLSLSAYCPTEWSPNPGWNFRVVEGIELHLLRLDYSNHFSFLHRLKTFFQFAWRAWFYGRKIDADLVLATSTPLTIALPGLTLSRSFKAPFVFEIRDLWPDVPIAMGVLRSKILIALARRLEKIAYSRAEKVIALSPGMAAGVQRRGKADKDVVVVPNCSDIELFRVREEEVEEMRRHLPWEGEHPFLVYSGTIGQANGLGFLVELAEASLRQNSDFMFLVVGDGKELAAVKRLALEKKVLGKNFFPLPPVAKKELPAILALASFGSSFFIPVKALWHNSANKFFDSLAAGRPVVINYAGWQAEILEANQAGIVLDPHSPQNAARVLDEKIKDEVWMKNARKNALRIAHEHFDREKLFLKFEETLLTAWKS